MIFGIVVNVTRRSEQYNHTTLGSIVFIDPLLAKFAARVRRTVLYDSRMRNSETVCFDRRLISGQVLRVSSAELKLI